MKTFTQAQTGKWRNTSRRRLHTTPANMPPHVLFPAVTHLSLKQICELPYKEQVRMHPLGRSELSRPQHVMTLHVLLVHTRSLTTPTLHAGIMSLAWTSCCHRMATFVLCLKRIVSIHAALEDGVHDCVCVPRKPTACDRCQMCVHAWDAVYERFQFVVLENL